MHYSKNLFGYEIEWDAISGGVDSGSNYVQYVQYVLLKCTCTYHVW
jgi:hypothetical protein